jgi:hypothetical protein
MPNKHTLLFLATGVLALAGAGYVKNSTRDMPRQEPIESEKRGSVRQQIKRAKLRGEKQLNLSGLVAMYEEARSVDDILRRYTVVVAQPIEERDYIDEHDDITSWYKFKVLETVSQPNAIQSLNSIQPPTELLPLSPDEILVPRLGGTTLVDGIELTRNEHDFPKFAKDQKYLLFVLLDDATRVGTAALGPAGVLIVKDDNSLAAINGTPLRLEKELKARHGEKLSEIKDGLAAKRHK